MEQAVEIICYLGVLAILIWGMVETIVFFVKIKRTGTYGMTTVKAVIIGKKRDPNTNIWILEVECPYCQGVHQHSGGNEDKPKYGSRMSGCKLHQRPYILEQD